MNIKVSIEDNDLCTSVHYKPTNSLKSFVVFMFTSIICREFHSLFSSEEMYAFVDKRGHHRAQLIDRQSTLQTSQKELSDFLVRSAL